MPVPVPIPLHWRDEIVQGYQRFRAGDFRRQKDLYESLGRHGQNPRVMLIACADSRADPSDIFDAHPGEMFVVRNVANLVPPKDESAGYHGTSAALEFAVNELEVEVIIVMGHESCGGIKACLAGAGHKQESYVGKWISILNASRERVMATEHDNPQLEMEFESVRESLRNLMSFECVQRRIANGSLSLMGAYFSIIRGVLMFADDEGVFREVPSAHALG